MAYDRRYLQRHGNQYRVVLKVPEKLRALVGKTHLVRPLHTDNLAVANRDKFTLLSEMRSEIEAAKKEERQRKSRIADPLTEEALQWREAITEANDDFIDPQDDGGPNSEGTLGITLSLLADRTEAIERREGGTRAEAFRKIATGKETPLLSLVESWLIERPMKPRQVSDYRRAVKKFDGWLVEKKLPNTVEDCSRRRAGAYITDAFVEKRGHARTVNKDISCLLSFWKWLVKKGYASENVWAGQSLPKPQPAKNEAKRPYTDEEIKTLFSGNPKPLLKDMMAIAALSGMRVEEIARLKAESIVDDCFNISEAKTIAGVRMVPIHPALMEIVTRRLAGKVGKDSLWPELPIPKPGSPIERSQKVVKSFGIYRRKMGVDDVLPGARQSRVDFHSFRRWFITKAEQARQPVHFVEALAGHKRLGMTLGRYSEGPLLAQLRECVEAVRLPEGCL